MSNTATINFEDVKQAEYASEEVFISHAGAQKDTFAVHLQRRFENYSVKSFLDEPSIKPGALSGLRMEAACDGVKLVIFVLTPDFLSSPYCMDELMWALNRKRQGKGRLPELLPVFYPCGKGAICVNDITRSTPGIDELVKKTSQPYGPSLEQRRADLEQLAKFCCIRLNSVTG
mmetsp:Transcript_12785/g.38532  ORF Transcript_12785/g.38532 Transcript_12785/m.38532 type:complete len:174 (-) Transcript_12785:3901-4422(-)